MTNGPGDFKNTFSKPSRAKCLLANPLVQR